MTDTQRSKRLYERTLRRYGAYRFLYLKKPSSCSTASATLRFDLPLPAGESE